MITRFLPLCTLDVTHTYYGGACRDFTYLVPADTAAVLRRAKMLLRVMDGRVHVLFEAAADGTPLLALPGARLRLGLQLANPAFFNYTILPMAPGVETAVYANSAAATALAAPVAAPLTGRVLTRTLSRTDRPVTVSVANAANEGPAPVTVTQVGAASASFDLDGFAPGLFTVTEDYTGVAITVTTTQYADAELSREPLFGVIEIEVAAAFYTAPAAFTIAFDAPTETLNYYVVAANYTDTEFGQLGVAHSATLAADAGVPVIAFTKIQSSAFTAAELPISLLGGDAGRVVLFRSSGPVKRRNGGYPGVQLVRDGAVIRSSLPQAAPDRPSADLVVHLSKSKP
jgi:hypothetical protein